MSSVLDLVATITLDTTQYDKGLDNSKTKAGTFGDAVKKGFIAAGGLAVKGLGLATAAAGAFGIASVKTGSTFDAAMSQVGATMGKTSKQMQDEVGTVDLKWGKFSGNLRDYAQEMGANTSFSATQAAEALNYMALAGYTTQQSMEMLPNVLNLAAAGAMDLGTASDMVTDAQSALGLETDETNKMVDEMAKTSTKTNTSVAQLGEAILTIGATARGVRGGTAELNQVLGILADNGIKGAEGGTHLRNMLLSLQNPTKEGVAALKQLGVEVYGADGKMRPLPKIFQEIQSGMDGMSQSSKDAMLSGLFNKTDLAAANALIGTNSKRWDEVAAAIADCEGAAQEMADIQLDNLQGDVTLFKSALEGAQIAVSDRLTPSLRGFVQEGSKGLTQFTKALKSGDLSGAIAGLGTTLANLAVSVVKQVPNMVKAGGQLLIGIGCGLAQNASTLSATAGQLVTFLYNGILQNAPAIISGGAKMITGIVQGITAHLPDVASKATELVRTVAEGIAAQVPTIAQSGLQLVSGLAQAIMSNAPVLVQSAVGMIESLGQGLVSGIPQFLEQALPMVEQFTAMLRENASTIVDAGMGLVLNIAQGIANSIPTLVKFVPQIVINIAGVINDNAPKLLSTGVQVVGKLVGGIIKAMPVIIANVPKIVQAIVSVFMAVNWLQLGGNLIKSIVSGVKSFATSLPQTIKGIGDTAVQWLSAINWTTLGADIIDLIVIGVQSLVTAIPTALQGIGTTAIILFKSIDWLGVGTFLVEGIISGIGGLVSAAVDAIVGLGNSILDGFKSLFGIASPSTVMEEQGNFLIQGLTNALTKLPAAILGILGTALSGVVSWGVGLATKGLEAAQGFATNVSTGFNSALDKVSTTVGGIKEKVGAGFATARTKVANAVNSIREKVGTGFNTALKKAATATTGIKNKVGEGFNTTLKKTANAMNSIRTKVSTGFSTAKDKVANAVNGIRDKVGTGFNSALQKVASNVNSIKDKVATTFNNTLKNVAHNINEIKDKIGSGFGDSLEKVASNVNSIKDKVATTFNDTLKKVAHNVNSIKDKIKTGFNDAKTNASTIFGDIKDKIKSKIDAAKNAVSSAVNSMKKKLKFKWSLPKLKMPHVKISGKFSINPPSAPKFSISWYKKAMDDMYMLSRPTIFGASGGKLLGGGEAGREIVVGEQKALDMISRASGNKELVTRVNYLIALLEYYLPKCGVNGSQLDRMLGALV